MAEENRKKHHRGRKKKKGGSNIVSNIILVIAIVVFAVSAYKLYGNFFRSTIKGTKNTKRFRIWSSIQTRRMTRKKRQFSVEF